MKKAFYISVILFAAALLAVSGCAVKSKEETSVRPAETVQFIPLNTLEYTPENTPEITAEPLPEETAEPEETPSSTPTPTSTPDPIKALIEKLDDRELIGQLVMCGFTGEYEPPQEFKELMEEYKLGNVILFGDNINTDEQTRTLTDALKALNPVPEIPLFISTDVEGGQVRRYDSWNPDILSAEKLYKKNDEEFTFEQFKRIGERLYSDGINMDLSPVLDVSTNQEKTFLGSRIFGGDTERVSHIASAEINGLHEAGMISICKHFPGHGGTATDSHEETPAIDKSLEELYAYDLVPFKNAAENGVDGVMVGHLLFPQIDSEVASVSKFFITDTLRDEFGFDGIVMSDDMRMGGIRNHYGTGEAAVRFIEAGGDLVLIGTYTDMQKDVFISIYEALMSGRLTRERLEESAYRIISKKMK